MVANLRLKTVAEEALVEVLVQRLPHYEDLALPSYQSATAAGLDLLAAVPSAPALTIAPGTPDRRRPHAQSRRAPAHSFQPGSQALLPADMKPKCGHVRASQRAMGSPCSMRPARSTPINGGRSRSC